MDKWVIRTPRKKKVCVGSEPSQPSEPEPSFPELPDDLWGHIAKQLALHGNSTVQEHRDQVKDIGTARLLKRRLANLLGPMIYMATFRRIMKDREEKRKLKSDAEILDNQVTPSVFNIRREERHQQDMYDLMMFMVYADTCNLLRKKQVRTPEAAGVLALMQLNVDCKEFAARTGGFGNPGAFVPHPGVLGRNFPVILRQTA